MKGAITISPSEFQKAFNKFKDDFNDVFTPGREITITKDGVAILGVEAPDNASENLVHYAQGEARRWIEHKR